MAVKIEILTMPAADMGKLNPMPDIKNVSYIHAGYEMTPKIREEEKTYIGKGMISTILPYQLQDGYNRNKQMRNFKAAVIENDHLKAVFLPELGGRLWSLYDKDLQRELLYVNPVYQPGNLGLRNAWFSGGVEFNVGIKGHNMLTCSPLWCVAEETDAGEVLRLYEYERIRGVVYSISAWIPENGNTLYLRCAIENKSNEEKHMYWWSNIAVPETQDTRVLVPTDESFLCFYNADHYVLDKATIPQHDGIDVSYPSHIPTSRDFFYKIPKEEKKWIATAEADGIGLLQCSTRELIGRKLFVWGQSAGGRNWNEWLSQEGSAYIEIQAGLAHTQLEHIPMPPKTTWAWTEAYTALQGDPKVLHGDYTGAIQAVDSYMTDRLGDANALPFPTGKVISSRVLHEGSDWGYVEEQIRGERISDSFRFVPVNNAETNLWKTLLETGELPVPSVDAEPQSYITGDFWLKKLENLTQQSWFSLLHIGVIKYATKDIAGAQKAWEDSLSMEPSPWAYRNLSMLYKSELGDMTKAREYILKAFSMKQSNPTLCKEVAMQLTADGSDALWLEIYDALSVELKELGRLRLYKAIALINLDRLEEAAQIINGDFLLSDIKEGELSVSHYWFRLYRGLYAKENGLVYDEQDKALAQAADAKYPLPKKLDFRMH